MEEELIALFSGTEFSTENGRSVKAFGESYHYPGSSLQPAELTGQLKSLVDSLNSEFCSDPGTPKINQCLVNRYQTDAPDHKPHLPEHSDNEPNIAPESTSFCISVGSSCSITFN